LLQTIVEEDKRGRVMSFYTAAVMGTTPFGSLLAGVAAAKIGAPYTLLISGIGCIAGALWFARTLPALRHEIRPIYVKMGILPQVASGLQKSSELTVPPEN
jgi:predicted MFS family arabinose efflux permease